MYAMFFVLWVVHLAVCLNCCCIGSNVGFLPEKNLFVTHDV